MSHPISLAIGEVSIRQHGGLFSLNDCHRASGGEAKHQPALFVRLDQTKALIAEIGNSTDQQSFKTIAGRNGGTYACRELVIAYAAWISAAFHLKVIRVFLATQAAPSTTTNHVDPEHERNAYLLASEVAAHAARAVFEFVMRGGAPSTLHRFMFCLRTERDEKVLIPSVHPIEDDAVLAPLSKLPSMLEDSAGTSPTNETLIALSRACTLRLARRLGVSQ